MSRVGETIGNETAWREKAMPPKRKSGTYPAGFRTRANDWRGPSGWAKWRAQQQAFGPLKRISPTA